MKQIHQIINEEILNVLDETVESTEEIKNLANYILKEIGEKNYENYNKKKSFDYIYGLNIDTLKSEGYVELKDFIENSNIQISFVPKRNEPITRKGEYQAPMTPKGERFFPKRYTREINLYYDYDSLKNNIDEYLQNFSDIDGSDVYFKLYYVFISTLIHELQHAYDDYRSSGQVFNTKQNQAYTKKVKDNISQNIKNDLYTFKQYLKLPHEVWARFSQAMSRTKSYTFNMADDGKITQYRMFPLNDVIKDFVFQFEDFDVLSQEMKNRLIKSATQFWHLEEEKTKKLNGEIAFSKDKWKYKVNNPLRK